MGQGPGARLVGSLTHSLDRSTYRVNLGYGPIGQAEAQMSRDLGRC